MIGEGVHDIYKERAKKGGDILWHVTIKGQKELSKGIPLHMSLKVFEDKKDMNLDEIKSKVKEFNIKTPNPKDLKFKPIIFTSDRDGKEYYMLEIEGSDKSYEDFYNSMKHCGTVYKKFMPHITIDKGLYDKVKKEGIKPEEVEFQDLTIEYGAGNTIHEFEKSELLNLEIIKETIQMNPDLTKHEKILFLDESAIDNYIQDNPKFIEEIVKKHDDRIKHHFGEDKELVNSAWEKGISKAYEVLKNRK